MQTFAADTYQLLLRHLRTTLRLPIWIAVTLVQPVIWLTLFGQLFRNVVELPGFSSGSYIQFLTPGVVVMTSLFSAIWSGMGMVEDLKEGVLDRLLTTPLNRASLIAARVVHTSITIAIQSVLILALGCILGAGINGGVGGFLLILLASTLLGAGIAALSNGLALVARREETLIAVANFFGMPLVFLSTSFMAAATMPAWIRTLAEWNPVDWAVVASRRAMLGGAMGDVWLKCGLLALFLVASAWIATQAFTVYRRTT
jgi:ABC-2 type transport system permease protein